MRIRRLDYEIRFYHKLASTNMELVRTIEEEDPSEGLVVQAEFQTEGKGHQDNTWESEAGKNLLISILLKPNFLSVSDQFHLSRIISLSLLRLVAKYCDEVRIKWPNDIYVGSRKIAGILIENMVQGSEIAYSIVGLGLNVNQEDFSSSLPNPTSLSLEKGCHFDMISIRDGLLSLFRDWYSELSSDHTTKIERDYLENIYGYDEWKLYLAGEESFWGKITGVLNTGELELETKENEKRTYAFKEISYLEA